MVSLGWEDPGVCWSCLWPVSWERRALRVGGPTPSSPSACFPRSPPSGLAAVPSQDRNVLPLRQGLGVAAWQPRLLQQRAPEPLRWRIRKCLSCEVVTPRPSRAPLGAVALSRVALPLVAPLPLGARGRRPPVEAGLPAAGRECGAVHTPLGTTWSRGHVLLQPWDVGGPGRVAGLFPVGSAYSGLPLRTFHLHAIQPGGSVITSVLRVRVHPLCQGLEWESSVHPSGNRFHLVNLPSIVRWAGPHVTRREMLPVTMGDTVGSREDRGQGGVCMGRGTSEKQNGGPPEPIPALLPPLSPNPHPYPKRAGQSLRSGSQSH